MSFRLEHDLAFAAWLKQPLGLRFLASERENVSQMAKSTRGYNAIILGDQGFVSCVQASMIKIKMIVNTGVEHSACKFPAICSRQDKLPIQSETVDLIYLAHCLEFANNPHEILREAYRVLRPDGNIVISIFNPFSIWGLWRLLVKCGGSVPWIANFMSLTRLKDWLALLGFDIIRVNHFGFYLPRGSANFLDQASKLERFWRTLGFPCGAAFAIEANKRVIPLSAIRPAWSDEQEIVANDLVEPT